MCFQREREVSLWSCCNGETLRVRSDLIDRASAGDATGAALEPPCQDGRGSDFGERSAKRGVPAHILYRPLTQCFLYRAGGGLKKT